MMLPASTCSPPKIFSPRRCPAESRPLRDDPPAFLCAITASETLVFCTYTEIVTKASPPMLLNVTYCCSTTSSCPLTAPWPPTSYPSPPVLLSASRVFWPTLEVPAPPSPRYRRQQLSEPRLGV